MWAIIYALPSIIHRRNHWKTQISQLLITSFLWESAVLSGNNLTKSDTGSCSYKFSTILCSFPFRLRHQHQRQTCIFSAYIRFCDMVLHLSAANMYSSGNRNWLVGYTSTIHCKVMWFSPFPIALLRRVANQFGSMSISLPILLRDALITFMVKYTRQICAKVFEVDHMNIQLYLLIISVIIYCNYLEYGKYG